MPQELSNAQGQLVWQASYKTRDMARADVFDYIEVFYNRSRAATVIWAESAPRRLSAPGHEAGICLPDRGQSIQTCPNYAVLHSPVGNGFQ